MGLYFKTLCFFSFSQKVSFCIIFQFWMHAIFQNKLKNAQLIGILILIEKSISRVSEKNIAWSSDRIFKFFNIEYYAYNQRKHGYYSYYKVFKTSFFCAYTMLMEYLNAIDFFCLFDNIFKF